MSLMSFPPKSNNHNMAVWMIAMMAMLWAIISMCALIPFSSLPTDK